MSMNILESINITREDFQTLWIDETLSEYFFSLFNESQTDLKTEDLVSTSFSETTEEKYYEILYKLWKYRNAVIMFSDELIKTTKACNRTIELYKNEIDNLRREKEELRELNSYKLFPKEKPNLPIPAQCICMINNDINGTRRTSYCIWTFIPQKGIFVDNNWEQILQGLGGIFWKEI